MKSEIAAVLAAASAFCLYATSYTWIGGTAGAWNVDANWVQTDDSSVHKVPSSWQDIATLACEDGDITITCSGYLEPALVFATNVTFHVASGTAYQKGSHSGSGNVIKTGAGTIELQSSSTRNGWIHINEGVAKIGNSTMISAAGGCVVGDGMHDAVLQINCDLNLSTVKFEINEGGIVSMGSRSIQGLNKSGSLEINGSGEMTFSNQSGSAGNGAFKLHASTLYLSGERHTTRTLAMRLGSQYQYDNGYHCAKINVEDVNDLEVDCHLLGALESNWDARDGYDLIGSGTLKLSAGSDYGGDVSAGEPGHTRVMSGRLFVDNVEGSGTGYSKVVVSSGAVLGGTGIIGGLKVNRIYGTDSDGRKDAYQSNPCVVVNGAAGNPGVLAPGSYEDTTNARIYGTLTVGGEESPSSVTMNANTKLAFEAGKGGATGLKVYGPLTLDSNVVLDVNVRDDAKTGDYVLVSATGGITGNYTLTGNAGAAKVVRSENQILLKIRKGLIITFR